MELGTALIIVFGVSALLYMLTEKVWRSLFGVIVALVIFGAMYLNRQSNIQSAAYAAEAADETRVCGTPLEFAKNDQNAEDCEAEIIRAKVNRYATDQCGGEYNTPHPKGYTICVARNYLQVCKSDPAPYLPDTLRDRRCDLLASRLAQFKD
jgi:hypothetical protein